MLKRVVQYTTKRNLLIKKRIEVPISNCKCGIINLES